MFDYGVVDLIEGRDIDRPRNAITLTSALHHSFGSFKIFFEPISGEEPHTYRVGSFHKPVVSRNLGLPVIRTLSTTPNQTIDPPLPRFFAIHNAIAHILHLSGAGDYIDKVLKDVEEKAIQVDGSTELGRLINLGLGGWLTSTCT